MGIMGSMVGESLGVCFKYRESILCAAAVEQLLSAVCLGL